MVESDHGAETAKKTDHLKKDLAQVQVKSTSPVKIVVMQDAMTMNADAADQPCWG